MKKMKTLALLFLAVIISSTGLTSCIDEDVDPAVAAIYTNQALLLASQANLNDANAAYLLALANLQDAYAAAAASAAAVAQQGADDDSAESAQDILSQQQQDAINAASAAQQLSAQEAALAQTIAMNAIALENALAALEIAKLGWEAQMIALQAAIDDAYVALASGYFSDYQNARNSAIVLEGQAMYKQSEIDMRSLLLNGNVSWEFYLSEQQDILTDLQASLAANVAAAAALEAAIADPTTAASQSSALQEAQDANNAIIAEWDVKIAELEAETLPLFEALSDILDLDGDYHNTTNQIENAENDIEYFTDMNESLQDDIDENLAAIASYDADTTAAAADVVLAQDAIDAKELELEGLVDAAVITQDELDDATDLSDASAAAVVTAQDAWDAQEGEVNLAAGLLVDALNATDGGAQAALDASLLAQIDTDAEYATAKAIFDADPAGTTYTQEYAGLDGVLGDHTDANPDSYQEVLLVNATPQVTSADVDFGGITWSDGSIAPVVGNLTTNAWGALVTGGGIDEGNYLDIEADDDVAPTNEDRFTAATAAKLAADDLVDADQATVDTFDLAGDIAFAQAAYDAQVIIFEGQQELVDAAQATADADEDLRVIAEDADIAADDAVIACQADIDGDLQDDLDDANDAVDALAAYTPEMMQEDIDEWAHVIVENNVQLGLINARLVDLMAELAVIEAAMLEAGTGADYTALIALFNEIEVLQDEQDALAVMNNAMQLVINAIGMDNEYLEYTLMYLLSDIDYDTYMIEVQENVIATGQIDEALAQAAITQCETELAAIEAQITGYNTLADKYWDLMLAALAG